MFDSCLLLPEDFDDYEWEITAKGFFSEAKICASNVFYSLNFYDQARLAQEVEHELRHDRVFFEPNLIVVQSVKRLCMERAAELLISSGQIVFMMPDKEGGSRG